MSLKINKKYIIIVLLIMLLLLILLGIYWVNLKNNDVLSDIDTRDDSIAKVNDKKEENLIDAETEVEEVNNQEEVIEEEKVANLAEEGELGEDNEDYKDTDGDGLYDWEEKKYKTDFQNKDTDGDGYNDKEEVMQKYNPLGPGELIGYREDRKIIDCQRKEREDARGLCYLETAKHNKDEEICEKISFSDKELEKRLKDSCYMDIVLLKPEKEICEKITDKVIKGQCKQNVVFSIFDEESCKNLEDMNNLCFYSIAIRKLDYQICDNIKDNKVGYYSRDNCIRRIAEELKYTNLCSEISDYTALFTCYNAIDLDGLSLNECKKFKGIDKVMCYSEINENIDVNICDSLEAGTKEKFICYYLTAKTNRDLNICEKINDEFFKEKCVKLF